MRNRHILEPLAIALILSASATTNAQPSSTNATGASPATRNDVSKKPNPLLPASPTGTPPESSPGRSPSDASGEMRGGNTGDYEIDQYGNRRKTTPKSGSNPSQSKTQGNGTRPSDGTKRNGANDDSTLEKMKNTVDSTDASMAATPGRPVSPRPPDLPAKSSLSGSK